MTVAELIEVLKLANPDALVVMANHRDESLWEVRSLHVYDTIEKTGEAWERMTFSKATPCKRGRVEEGVILTSIQLEMKRLERKAASLGLNPNT